MKAVGKGAQVEYFLDVSFLGTEQGRERQRMEQGGGDATRE